MDKELTKISSTSRRLVQAQFFQMRDLKEGDKVILVGKSPLYRENVAWIDRFREMVGEIFVLGPARDWEEFPGYFKCETSCGRWNIHKSWVEEVIPLMERWH